MSRIFSILASMLSRMSSSSTPHAWSADDELALALDEGSCCISTLLELAGHPDHLLDGGRLGSVIEIDVLKGTCSTGGVTLRGGGATYDLFRMSQNADNSMPSSITPFNIFPYLNYAQPLNHRKIRASHLVTTLWSLSVVHTCPRRATVQVSAEILSRVPR